MVQSYQMNSNDLIPEAKTMLQTQTYKQAPIDGVKMFSLNIYKTEDGSFSELMRFTDQRTFQKFPEFFIAQINRSIMLPHTVKAWHLHFHQDEIWSVSPFTHLILGLWDVRASSPTKGLTMKIPLTAETLVYIPRGVAHGAANHMTREAEILYFVNNTYDRESPDEQRLPWDAKGKEFWEMKRE
ncbi:MAG: dTDP-4-dehydrorhamnose 3,5-epimerase family protein [Patescibacteria group bacterium]|nr:dTDP-4-dehydrorhamnose 3,5-epimerase family protein [Patescibacteria group bacterium]